MIVKFQAYLSRYDNDICLTLKFRFLSLGSSPRRYQIDQILVEFSYSAQQLTFKCQVGKNKIFRNLVTFQRWYHVLLFIQ